jgi:hypothetical protein
MTTQREKDLAAAIAVIKQFPVVEPNVARKNPLCLYDSYSASHAYRFAREAGDLSGVGYTHTAIDLGEGYSLDYVKGWAGRVHRPQLIVTRSCADLSRPKTLLNRWLYEVWYVRPETVYQTIQARGWGWNLTPHGRKLQWDVHDRKLPITYWRYRNVAVADPHFAYVCRHCGEQDYFETPTLHLPMWSGRPTGDPAVRRHDERRVELASKGICGTCEHFLDTCGKIPHRDRIIAAGTHYAAGGETNEPARWRGFGGRRFLIRFNDGRELTTTNLWCQGRIPEGLIAKYPDRFADNASIVEG